MKHGICTLSIVPLRKESAHRSEMVSQLLFGELFEILEEQSEWTLIRTDLDGYVGWIQNGQFSDIGIERIAEYQRGKRVMVGRGGGRLYSPTHRFDLHHGTVLYLDSVGSLVVGEMNLKFEGTENEYVETDFSTQVIDLAMQYRDTPYLWGGRTESGIDCSGFSQLIYRCFQKEIPRDAWQQAEIGTTVDFISEVKPGDLAFFDNEDGRITHVGIMLDTDTIIHASAKVRIDRMDAEGIFKPELKRYSHKLRIIKRY